MTIAASLTVRREGLNCPLRKWDGVDRKEREAHNQRRGILQKRPPLLVLPHQPGGPSIWLPLLVDEERNWVSYLFLAVSGLSCFMWNLSLQCTGFPLVMACGLQSA